MNFQKMKHLITGGDIQQGSHKKGRKKKSQESFKTRAPFDLYSPKEIENDFTFSSKSNQSRAFWNPDVGRFKGMEL